jgi:RNA-binding protein NOB1
MQMNIKLLSPESGGMVINKLKNWVLRCHACFHITTDTTKKFCPACGNSGTLLRASTQVDSKTGQMKVFLKENFTYRMRGTQFSVPLPKGGRRNNDLILREDQVEYKRAVKKHERAIVKQSRNPTNPFDPDYVPAILIDATGKKSQHVNPLDAPVIGYGKRNPNEVRRQKK